MPLGTIARVLFLGLVSPVLGVLAGDVAHARQSQANAAECAPGRYLPSSTVALTTDGAPFLRAIVIDGDQVTLDVACDDVRVRRRFGRRGLRIRARLLGCAGVSRPLRIGAVRSRDCERMDGWLRPRRARRQRFSARLSACGDGRIDAETGEECDGFAGCAGASTCSRACTCRPGPPMTTTTSVTIATTPPSCGNLFWEDTEECDGYAPVSCLDLGFDGGTTACTATCQLDDSGCCACGNGKLEAACGEVCDGGPPPGRKCETEGFSEGGPLGCKNTCDAVETNGCFRCGNGIKEGPEECDSNDFGPEGDACTGPWPEHGGILRCLPSSTEVPDGACRISRAQCYTCGDGIIDFGEECDDGDLVAHDGCSELCERECGDGSVGRGESCDDGNGLAGDGCDDCRTELPYGGGNDEAWDECSLRWSVSAVRAGAAQPAVETRADGLIITCQDGTTACDRDAVAGQCTFLVFYCLRGASDLCSASLITRVALRDATTLDTAARDDVLAAVADVMRTKGNAGSVTSVEPLPGELAAIAPDVPVNAVGGYAPMCGALSVVVPRPNEAAATRILAMTATDSRQPPRVDADRLTFVCTP